MSGKLLPAIIAAVITIITVVIIGIAGQFIPFVGCCNCAMPVIGDLFAAFLYSNKAAVMNPGSGASVGVLAGVIYSIMSLLIVPISLYIQWNKLQLQFEQMTEQFRRSGMNIEGTTLIIAIVIGSILGIAIVIGLFALGGVLGGVFFKKDSQPESSYNPPMPPSFGA